MSSAVSSMLFRLLFDDEVEMAVVRARHASEIRSVLTSEQLELLDERRERRKQFRDERRERFESFRERRQQR